MNPKDILEMEAGVELDMLVSEFVMKLPIHDKEWPCGVCYDSGIMRASREKPTEHTFLYYKPYPVVAETYNYEDDGKMVTDIDYEPIPEYSYDSAAALSLLELDWFKEFLLMRVKDDFEIVDINFQTISKSPKIALCIARAAAFLCY